MNIGVIVGLTIALIYSLTTFRYDMGDKQLRITFLGATMRTLNYPDIQSVEKGWNMGVNQYLSGNFAILWDKSKAVTVRLKSGAIKNIVLSPDNPDAFIAELKKRAGL